MTIFEVLGDILTKKKGDLLNNADNEQAFSPFITQRWLSMHSEPLAKIVNETTNKLWPIFQDSKKGWYQTWIALIPSTRPKRINYIKKVKEESSPETKTLNAQIALIAKNKEISRREVEMYIQLHNLEDKIKSVNV